MGRFIRIKEAALACSIALPLALQMTDAMAYSTEPAAPQQAPQQSAVQPVPLSPFGQQLSLPGKAPDAGPADPLALGAAPGGMEVTIPGIGSVGTLPKLDFGLELLYGSKTAPDALQFDQHGVDQHVPEEGMQIKGTLSFKY